MDGALFLAAFGLYLVFEGLMPFAWPNRFKQFLESLLQMSDGQLRFAGGISILLGLGILYGFR